MTSPDKFLVIQAQYWIIRVQKIGMEYNLHAVRIAVEKFYASDLVQNGVRRVVSHVMGSYWRKRVSFERKDAPFEKDLIFFRDEV
jgi:hypothetical protein